jgi:hypothetical protein
MNVAALLAKKLAVYLAAVATAYVLAVAGASGHVAGRLATMGVVLGPGERFAMVLSDLAGMVNLFLPMVAFALLVAFLVAALLCRWPRRLGTGTSLALYALAGFSAVACIHLAMQLAFGLTPVAVARSLPGLFGQGLAGAVGGLLYLWLNRLLFPRSPFEADA